MIFNHRIYNGKNFRPKPEVYFEPDANLLIIATPWGARNSAKKAIQTISDFLLSSVDDPDFTSPFSIMSCISSLGNHLRIALMLTNDAIYQEENKNEYTTGLEILVAMRKGKQLAWANVGHPNIYLDRTNSPLQPVSAHYDLSLNYSTTNSATPPLPGEFIGVYPTSNINIQTMHINRNDSLVFLSHSHVPSCFYGNTTEERSIESMVNSLSKSSPDSPFWLGKLQF